MEKLSIDDPVLKNVVFVDFSKRENVDLVLLLMTMFYSLLKALIETMEASAVNKLSEECLDYQLIAEIPDSAWAETTVKVEKNADNDLKKEFYTMDVLWG